MATNLDIDPELLERALVIGGEKTKKATVNKALAEFIDRRGQAEILDSLHTFDDWDPDYDYKQDRTEHDHKLSKTA